LGQTALFAVQNQDFAPAVAQAVAEQVVQGRGLAAAAAAGHNQPHSGQPGLI
jgi:hypothetical protein